MVKPCLYDTSDDLLNGTQVSIQELQLGHCGTLEFIDEHRLLGNVEYASDQPQCLVVIDTEKYVEGAPMQTVFDLPPRLSNFEDLGLLVERGVHRPSPAETLAPFYQDPTQRIIALDLKPTQAYCPIIQVAALLDLLESNEGYVIRWYEWKSCVVIPSIDHKIVHAWVSGCRLFCATSTGYGEVPQMEVFDFSMRGRAKYLGERVNRSLGGIRYSSSTGVKTPIPDRDTLSVHNCLESTVFHHVSVRTFCSL